MKIKKLVIEIITLSLFLLIFVPILKNSSIKLTMAANNMNSVGSIELTEIHSSSDTLFPMTEDFALEKGDKTILNLKNKSSNLKNYTLLLRVEKDSTLDIKFLNYSINDDAYNFKEKIDIQDEQYNYYELYNNIILENSSIDIQFYIWLKSTTQNEAMNKKLKYSFIVKENNELALK